MTTLKDLWKTETVEDQKKRSLLGQDSYKDSMFLFDWKQFKNDILLPTYIDNPLVARQLLGLGSGSLVPVEWNGKITIDIPTMDDVDDPHYEFESGVADDNMTGGVITAYLPTMYKTYKTSYEAMAETFAGRAKLPIIIQNYLRAFANFEDRVVFRGDSDKKQTGLVGSRSKDLGNPTGAWGIIGATTKLPDNMIADVNKAISYFTVEGQMNQPIDMVVTSYVDVLLDTIRTPQSNLTMRQYILAMLRGGSILSSNNLQASVTTTANTALFVVRDPNAWYLFASGLDQRQDNVDLWNFRYGLRQKTAVLPRNDKFVAYMDGISNATS